jgi:hypothetical protein
VKIPIRGTLAAGILLLASPTQSPAIEGLQISVQSPDVILTWPSIPGENYIVQWRPTLDPSSSWVTLTNSLPADGSANWTTFVHSNQLQTVAEQNLVMSDTSVTPTVPQAFPAKIVNAVLSGQDSYPLSMPSMPDIEMNGVMVSWESVHGPMRQIMMPIPDFVRERVLTAAQQGALRVIGTTSSNAASETDEGNQMDPTDDPQPADAGGGTASPPQTGFYQVVRDGVRIWGLTNLTGGVILSNTVNVVFEAGNAAPNSGTNVLGTLNSAALTVDGLKFPGDGVLGPPQNSSPWRIVMDTGYLENGDHTLQVEVTWQNPDSTDNNNQFLTRYSDPFTITVSNAIYYPQWEPEIGELDISAYFAKTTCTDADWQIDIYDASSNLVNTQIGRASCRERVLSCV